MCQHSRDGGNRCPVHRHDSAAIIKIATNESNLLPKQMENLFSELRREGRGAAAPTETEWKAKLDELEAEVKDTDIAKVSDKLNKARQHSNLPDGATAYAQNLLVERAKLRATNLDNKLREIGQANGLTLAQARAKFVEEYNTVDRTRGADVPPEYTQMSRRRAVQAGIPYDKATVVALARVAADTERGPRRVERVPATVSTYISEYGYNEDGGRFEIVFRNNPDIVFAYHNVPESTWEQMTAYSASRIYVREIHGNSEYMYDSAEEAEADAHQVRCTSCGQFRASAHACPRREVSDALAEQGFDAAKIAEIVDVVAPALIDTTQDQEPEENPAPTVADSVPAVVYAEDIASLEIPEETPVEEVVEAPRRSIWERAAAVETEPEAVEPVVEEPVFIPEPVGVLMDIESARNPELTIHADAKIAEDYVPTAELQRHPKPLELSEGVEVYSTHEVDSKYVSIVGKGREYVLTAGNQIGGGFTEEERDEIKAKIATGITYVIGHGNSSENTKPVILEKYNSKTHSVSVLANAGWHGVGNIKSKYSIKRYGHRVTAEPISRETKIELQGAETTRLEALVADNKAVVVASTTTMTRKYKVDGNRATNPRISFGSATAFRRAIKDGKTAITTTSWELEDTSGNDDQGYAYPSGGYRSVVEGEVAVRRNAAGIMEVVSSERTLKCSCNDYRSNYYCEHINYVQRHLPNVAQQVMPAERTHALLTASLASRADVSVVDNGKTPAYISFGEAANLNGPGSSRDARGHWTPYSAVSIPAGVVSNYANPTDEDIIAVNALETAYLQMRAVGAPPNLAGVHQALRRADVSIPVTAQFSPDGSGFPAGIVTGTMMIHRDADNESYSTTGHTLKCTCAEYQEKYDCPHIRLTTGQPQVFLNIGARHMDTDRNLNSFRSLHNQRFRREEEIQTYMRRHRLNREDAVVAIDAARAAEEERTRSYRERRDREEAEYRAIRADRDRTERERIERLNAPLVENLKTYRESMMKRWETQDDKYSENPELFYNEYKESLARKRKGDVVIPFNVEGGVTDGVCAPVPGARQFGVELEFDIDRNLDYNARKRALKKIGQELHAAGLTKGPDQTYYHAAAANGYEKWSFEEDCTVDAELVSPIMSDTPEHWKELQTAVEIITRNGGKATTRCGSHVHVSTASYGASTAKHAELLRTVNQNEDVLYRLASDPARGKHRGTRWCAPNLSDKENDVADDIQNGHNVLGYLNAHELGLNFEGTSKKEFMKSNIEFRMWDGTLDPAAIQQQVKVSAAITDYAERSVIENKGSKKPTEARKTIGHGKGKENAALSKAETTTHTAESFAEANSHVGEFLDKLFRRNEDKAGVAALFASTNWQSAGR